MMTEAQQAEAVAILTEIGPSAMQKDGSWSPEFIRRRDALLAAVQPDPVKVLDDYFGIRINGGSPASRAWSAIKDRLSDNQTSEQQILGRELLAADYAIDRLNGGRDLVEDIEREIRSGRHRAGTLKGG